MVKLRQTKRKKTFITAMVMIVVGFGFLGAGIFHAHSSRADETTSKPNFSPVLPKGETIESLDDWQKLTSPNGDAFYVYIDTISGVTVNVSQQVLPGKFKNDLTNQMIETARAYNATTKLDAEGTTIYVGSSAEGPQSVLFSKNGLLVLMKSWASIPDAEWIAYVKSLQ